MKLVTDVCPICAGSGWKTVSGAERGVTRCDCQLRARNEAMVAAARIPKRYEHCELSNFTADFPGADHSLSKSHLSATRFVEEFDPREGKGLLLVGGIGTGKTHLAVGILKELIATRSAACLFCDYRELLKQIQNSYNDSVQANRLLEPLRTSNRDLTHTRLPATKLLAIVSGNACAPACMKCVASWR